MHPIAPLALVTNGSHFQLFDVVSKDRVTPDKTLFDDRATITLPDETRLEALRLFFGLSSDNLGRFARAQVARTTAPLFGQPSDPTAVYIASTHVERKQLTSAFREFLASDKPLFVLVGDSGMGKTCVSVDCAKTLLEDGYAVFLFRGAMIEGNLLDEVATEVEWAFGPQRGSIDTLRRLADSAGGTPVVLVIDGVEDWRLPEKVQHFASVVAHLDPKKVRLVDRTR